MHKFRLFNRLFCGFSFSTAVNSFSISLVFKTQLEFMFEVMSLTVAAMVGSVFIMSSIFLMDEMTVE